MATTRTVRQLIETSLKRCGVFEIGETPESEIMANSLQVLQDLLAERAGDFFVSYVVQEAITLVNAQNSYTVGEDGSPDLNTQRPEKILGAFIRDSNNHDYPVKVIGEKAYRLIASKTTAARPEKIWYNPTAPNGTIYTWGTPTSAESLYISSLKTLTEPTSVTQNLLDTVGIPRNYHNPLAWMLAFELCDEFGKEPTVTIIARSQQAERDLVALNMARSIEPAHIEIGSKSQSSSESILSF